MVRVERSGMLEEGTSRPAKEAMRTRIPAVFAATIGWLGLLLQFVLLIGSAGRDENRHLADELRLRRGSADRDRSMEGTAATSAMVKAWTTR